MTPRHLSQIRKRLGMSQRDLASRLGISQPLIARMESGTLSLGSLARLAIEALATTERRRDLEWTEVIAPELCADCREGDEPIYAESPNEKYPKWWHRMGTVHEDDCKAAVVHGFRSGHFGPQRERG